MTRFVNFSTRDVQLLPEEALKGALLKLPSDVSKLPDGKLVIPLWERVRLSELLFDELTDEQKDQLRSALGLDSSNTIDDELPKMVLLDEIEDVTRSGQQAISFRIYIDD